MIHHMGDESGSRSHVLSVVVCGAAPASSAGTLVREAVSRGWTVQVIATPSAMPFLDLESLGALSGRPVRSQYSKPGDPRSLLPEAIIVAPATFNTINQWALGIADNYALGILAEQTGLEIPIVTVPFVSQALAARPPFQRSIRALRAEGVSVLFGPGGIEPHPVHTEAEHADAFPWLLALDEVSGMTGFGVTDTELVLPRVTPGAAS
jgi:phosphopantothenoylcysteine synthetase/decarboxylase